jgi:hypothetical protein
MLGAPRMQSNHLFLFAFGPSILGRGVELKSVWAPAASHVKPLSPSMTDRYFMVN